MKLTNKEKLFLAMVANRFDNCATDTQQNWVNTLIEKLVVSADGEMGLFYWTEFDDVFAMDEAKED